MANYMFVLRSKEKTHRVVCPDCSKRGEIVDSCRLCHGSGVKRVTRIQFYTQDQPVEIVKTDRDPKTGILRYWENMSDFWYETTTHKLNRYVPDVPYGMHLCHDTRASAERECERINKFLNSQPPVENFMDSGLINDELFKNIVNELYNKE